MQNPMTNAAMTGVLVVVRVAVNHGDVDTLVVEPIDLDTLEPGQGEEEIFTNCLQGALNYVRKIESDNIAFDLPNVSSDIRRELEEDLIKVRTLTWGEPNEAGHYVIDSIWAGGELKEGFQWRFAPIAI